MKVVWGVPLLLLGLLGCLDGAEEGCKRWHTSQHDTVCCEECKQGNRLVDKCGADPKKLCELCKEGTYISSPGRSTCLSCTQCTGLYEVKQPCSRISNTVCGCKTGYRCGDPKCSFCSQECGVGQQSVDNRTCQACPPGTFNDKPHSKCVPWSTRCPQPEQKIVTNGTAVSDVFCDFIPQAENGHTIWMIVAILVIAFTFVIMVITLLAFILIRWTTKKKKKIMVATIETTAEKPTVLQEVQRLVEQESLCWCPQQEQGSSLESVDSLDSKLKLLAV
ncbi:tumor necrosis factor receptor superfamily member 9b [Conger conger]|uniref:tumor necrosis factor receptor superfamily member 9b n=1 Tax=Conger conger TaxID=82655 RepID=UPI002A5A25DA|nr:tumor necrosis factor receptor superfamily member 9b [Conger conger]